MSKTQKILSAIIISLSLFLTAPVLAQVTASPDLLFPPGIPCALYDPAPDPRATLLKIVNLLSILVGIIFIICILIYGYIWTKNENNKEKSKKAKKMMIIFAIGLGVCLAIFLIASSIYADINPYSACY